jgi:hypothetical protein
MVRLISGQFRLRGALGLAWRGRAAIAMIESHRSGRRRLTLGADKSELLS